MNWSDVGRLLSPDEIMRKYGEGWAVAAFFVYCAIFGVVFIGVVLKIAKWTHERRSARRQSWGARYGLRLLDTRDRRRGLVDCVETDVGTAVLADYPYVNVFRQRMAMAMHILEGVIDNLPTRVFESRYITGRGKHTVEHHFSVVAFDFGRVMPYTALRRHSWRDGLTRDDVQSGRTELDRQFYIWADDWRLLSTQLPADVERIFLQSRLFEFILADDKLVVLARGRLKDEGYDRLLADARRLASWVANVR